MYRHSIALAALMILIPMYTSAATLFLTQSPSEIGMRDSVQITLSVSSDIALNTFAGSFVFPIDLFDIESVSDGSSIVKLWLTQPQNAPGTIPFAGFSPGGFSGKGELFQIVLRAKRAGTAQISVVDPQLLRNDGAGSRESIHSEPLLISISSLSRGSFIEQRDMEPPEPFVISFGQQADLYEGRAYLYFSAIDKGSGIDHYEAAELTQSGGTTLWRSAGNPYVIADQSLMSDVYIKAVDRAGNERTSVFPHKKYATVYDVVLLGGILIVLLALWILAKRLLASRS